MYFARNLSSRRSKSALRKKSTACCACSEDGMFVTILGLYTYLRQFQRDFFVVRYRYHIQLSLLLFQEGAGHSHRSRTSSDFLQMFFVKLVIAKSKRS